MPLGDNHESGEYVRKKRGGIYLKRERAPGERTLSSVKEA